jgi:hypothetical protein
MVKIAKREAARKGIRLMQSHCGSASALKNILTTARLNRHGKI